MKKFALVLAMAVLFGFSSFAFCEPVSMGLPTSVGGIVAGGVDPDYSFIFSGMGVGGYGTLDTTPNGDGTFTATGGSVTVTSSGDGFTGTLPLYPNPTPTGYDYSPSGYFIYDDQLLPLTDPVITNPGLLFTALPVTDFELNLFSTGPGSYLYWDNNGYNAPISFILSNEDAVSIPLPASFWTGLGLFAVMGALRLRHRRHLL
jgi:hypothetical protein